MRSEYRAVVFDMDGVIFDSEKAVMECWKELASKYQIKEIENTIKACMGTTKEETKKIMLQTYGEDFPYTEYAKEASKRYHEKYDGGRLPMKPGVVELLTYLKQENKKIALASSTRQQVVVQQLKDADIFAFFDVVICGDMVQKSKPAPDIYLKACENLGVSPDQAYAIEDSYHGIQSAFAGKLRPIMVPDQLEPNEDMEKKAETIRKDLLEVLEYLKNL